MMAYAPLNNHEAARRRIWTEVYVAAFSASPPAKAVARLIAATDAADTALHQFDKRFQAPVAP